MVALKAVNIVLTVFAELSRHLQMDKLSSGSGTMQNWRPFAAHHICITSTVSFSFTVVHVPLNTRPARSTSVLLALLNKLKQPSNNCWVSLCDPSFHTTLSWKTSVQTTKMTAVQIFATMRRLLIDVSWSGWTAVFTQFSETASWLQNFTCTNT